MWLGRVQFLVKESTSLHLCRYDYGCEGITNIDFSKPVIANMMRKNLRQRPKMKWKVGDMTDLKVRFPYGKLPSKLSFSEVSSGACRSVSSLAGFKSGQAKADHP